MTYIYASNVPNTGAPFPGIGINSSLQYFEYSGTKNTLPYFNEPTTNLSGIYLTFVDAPVASGAVDNFIIELWNRVSAGNGPTNGQLDIYNGSRTSDSDVFFTALTSTYGWTINIY